MPLPSFLILGAARSATTSLHYYLRAHPQIVMSQTKEPNFFLFAQGADGPTPLISADPRLIAKSVTARADYERLFQPDGSAQALGEASPLYLFVPETPQLIKDTIEDPRLIAVLRDPVLRAFSHYASVQRGSDIDLEAGFREAVEAEMLEHGYSPYATGTHYLRLGLYGEQVARYHELFDAEQLLLLTFEELTADPAGSLRRICEILGVDESYDFGDLIAYNGSAGSTSAIGRRLSALMARAQPWVKWALPARVVAPLARFRATRARPGDAPTIAPELRARLVDYYRDDLRLLQDISDLDLSHWPTAVEAGVASS